jgi:hypothetical protein
VSVSMSTIEELLGRKSRGSGLESREYGPMDPSRRTPTGDGLPVGIVHSRTQATEFIYIYIYI